MGPKMAPGHVRAGAHQTSGPASLIAADGGASAPVSSPSASSPPARSPLRTEELCRVASSTGGGLARHVVAARGRGVRRSSTADVFAAGRRRAQLGLDGGGRGGAPVARRPPRRRPHPPCSKRPRRPQPRRLPHRTPPTRTLSRVETPLPSHRCPQTSRRGRLGLVRRRCPTAPRPTRSLRPTRRSTPRRRPRGRGRQQ